MNCPGSEAEILHKRYAEALIGIAEEAGRLDCIAEGLASFNELIREGGLFAKILQHPEIDREDKLKVLDAISKNGRFCEEFHDFLKVLTEKNRLNIIHGIFLKYCDMYSEKKKRAKVFIRTAVSLGKAHIERLRGTFSRALKKDIIVEESIQPSLIGGLDIRIGDVVYNMSLSYRLGFMEDRLGR